eukprot:1184953-Prorocentrum_minimum.AAC.3
MIVLRPARLLGRGTLFAGSEIGRKVIKGIAVAGSTAWKGAPTTGGVNTATKRKARASSRANGKNRKKGVQKRRCEYGMRSPGTPVKWGGLSNISSSSGLQHEAVAS